jgi:protein-S-isoprenylcysteine O-methyltransferase Ste14
MSPLKLIAGIIFPLVIFGGFLFLPAGTLHWWRAWLFLGVVFVSTMATMVSVFPGRKDLLSERYKPLIQKGQPFADKIVVVFFVGTFYALIISIPLDVFHLHLMGKPGALVSSLGLVLFVAGWWMISLAFRENDFAATVVKHLEERQQIVVDTGVYGVVRHPMYAGSLFLFVGMPLWLESYAAALFAIVPTAALVLRIFVEEKFLKRELAGYAAYTERVRFRLIPFLW